MSYEVPGPRGLQMRQLQSMDPSGMRVLHEEHTHVNWPERRMALVSTRACRGLPCSGQVVTGSLVAMVGALELGGG